MRTDLYRDLYELEDKHWWHISKRQTCIEFIKNYLKKTDLMILDIGCGSGKNIEEFSKYGFAFGIDISKEAITFCKKRGLTNIKQGSSYNTGFKKSSFDLVTMLDVLEHTDDQKTLNEVHRVLKRKGMLIITVPAFDFLWSRWDEVLNHRRRYTKRSLENILISSRFNVVKTSYMYSFLILPVFLLRIIKSIAFKKKYPSDFKISNNLINKLLLQITATETRILKRIDIPFGTSLICVCSKK